MNEREQANTLIRETAKKSLYFLCKALLKFKDVTENTHGDIIRNLESDTKRKLIVVPRGSLKSTISDVAYPIWLLIRDPNLRILIDSELYMNSSKFLREIKSHLESPVFSEVFGDFKGSTWNDNELLIKQRTQVKKEASITVGGIGTTKVGQHYDVIIGDDYNSPKNSNTPEAAAKVVDHYKYNTSILEPTGIYAIIGTRYSSGDVIGHILREELGVEGSPESGEYETTSAELNNA